MDLARPVACTLLPYGSSVGSWLAIMALLLLKVLLPYACTHCLSWALQPADSVHGTTGVSQPSCGIVRDAQSICLWMESGPTSV
jgi:hypothetical protein